MKLKIVSNGTYLLMEINKDQTAEFFANPSSGNLTEGKIIIAGVEFDITLLNYSINPTKKFGPLSMKLDGKEEIPDKSSTELLLHIKPSTELVQLKRKRKRKWAKFHNPTDYVKDCFSRYKDTISEGEGLYDLEYVMENGISPSDRLSWFIFWYLNDTAFVINKHQIMTTKKILEFLREKHSKTQSGLDFIFDRTTINHTINRFHFAGLLSRVKKGEECSYGFENIIKRRGMDWYIEGNEFLKGAFQPDSGFLDLRKEINN